MKTCLKNIIKSGIKQAIILKNSLIVNQFALKKYLKIKTQKSYEGITNTNFQEGGISKESSHCICLSVILIDSVLKMRRNCYLQVFLQYCNYIVKENKINKYINNYLEIPSDWFIEEEDGCSNEETSDDDGGEQTSGK